MVVATYFGVGLCSENKEFIAYTVIAQNSPQQEGALSLSLVLPTCCLPFLVGSQKFPDKPDCLFTPSLDPPWKKIKIISIEKGNNPQWIK